MDLLSTFDGLVQRFQAHHTFAERARALADRYSAVVVDRVVRDHADRTTETLSELIPLLIEVETAIADIEAQVDAIKAQGGDDRAALEELQLRALIGEMDDDALDAATTDLRRRLSGADTEITRLAAEADTFRARLTSWQQIASQAGVLAEA
jgi:chromosome segregation ATPase